MGRGPYREDCYAEPTRGSWLRRWMGALGIDWFGVAVVAIAALFLALLALKIPSMRRCSEAFDTHATRVRAIAHQYAEARWQGDRYTLSCRDGYPTDKCGNSDNLSTHCEAIFPANHTMARFNCDTHGCMAP